MSVYFDICTIVFILFPYTNIDKSFDVLLIVINISAATIYRLNLVHITLTISVII